MLYEAVIESRATMFFLLDAIGFEVVLESTLSAHRRILEAIERSNAGEAERAAIDHVETTRRELYELVRKGERGP